MAFKDLRTCLDELKRQNLLFTITRLVDKDSELMPLVRWQYRGLKEEERAGPSSSRTSPTAGDARTTG